MTKIGICTIGSRGDVQPFLILGEYLSKNGYEVKVASANKYELLAKKYEVEYIAFEGDYGKLIDSDEMKKLIGKNPFTIKKKLKQEVYPIIENSITTFYEISKWADIVIYHPKSLVDAFGYQFPEKLIKAYVVPLFSPTKEFPSPLLRFLPIPSFLNKLTYSITNALLTTVKAPVKNFYKKHNLKGKLKFIQTPVIYGISPSFIKKPSDYPDNVYYSGFWFDKNSNESLDKYVTDFLNTEKKKLIITFGSMPYKSEIDINNFIKRLTDNLDIKVLVVKGWGLKEKKIINNENVLSIDYAPFDKLFTLSDAVLHHGGAGTTAIALKSGIPMMICPILYPVGDQFFWGKQIEKLGLGVKPIPLSKLKVKSLLNSINELIKDKYRIKSLEIKKRIDNENGLETALKIIEQIKNKTIYNIN